MMKQRPNPAGVSPDRRRFLGLTAGTLAGLSLTGIGLAGCSRREPLLRIASNVWPGYELLYVARHKEYFASDVVRMVEMPSATACVQALAAGSVEGACLTLDEVLTAKADGLALKVVAILDLSLGADALLVRPGIETLADLRGRRIGVEQSAVGAVMLDAVLKAGDLIVSDVETVHMNVNLHRQAYLEDKVDALITFEPVISQLTEAGARRLFDSAAIPGRIVDVIAVKPSVLEQSPVAVRALVAGHFLARQAFLDNPTEVAPLMSARLNLDAAEVPRAFDGLELPDTAFNRDWLQGPQPRVEQAAADLNRIMLEARLLPHSVDVAGLADSRFLPEG